MRLWKRLVDAPAIRREELLLQELVADYTAEIALAQQQRAHAELAPYPAAAVKLNELAAADEGQAKRLAELIGKLGGTTPEVNGEVRAGKSHWARLMIDLEAKRLAGNRYLEQAITWENESPDVGALLRELEREEQEHRVMLRDLIAKSDPQALD